MVWREVRLLIESPRSLRLLLLRREMLMILKLGARQRRPRGRLALSVWGLC